jgi:hypothetical protein
MWFFFLFPAQLFLFRLIAGPEETKDLGGEKVLLLRVFRSALIAPILAKLIPSCQEKNQVKPDRQSDFPGPSAVDSNCGTKPLLKA